MNAAEEGIGYKGVYIKISYAAVFGSLAAVISLLRIEIPMPILFWLKFDFAEIPDMIAYFLGGFKVGLSTAFIHMIILNMAAEHPGIGPAAKFLAVISMMIGISLYRRWRRGSSLIGMLSIAIILRVFIMTIANIVIFYVFLPGLLKALPGILSPFFGEIRSIEAALIVTLLLTGIYNIIHTLLTLIISVKIYGAAIRYLRAY